ncbi:MAG: hypothetical protein QOF61_901 [Acidobacteriota bacterium]|jgi:hypothetical protein|nr:hypothetical protein [Acidobacteriota bacterium]
MSKNKLGALALSLLFLVALVAHVAVVAAQDGSQMNAAPVDKRKLTTIQTTAADYGKTKNAVEVRYLNLPWGEATFGYIETGIDSRNNGYYSGRAWPIAHLRLNVPATYDGKKLTPGDYAFVITPRNAKTNTDMTLALESFKPAETGGSFLKAGDVFVETPKDAQVVSQKTIKFAKGGAVAPQLEMWVGKQGKNIDIKFHYGDRTLTEKLKLT